MNIRWLTLAAWVVMAPTLGLHSSQAGPVAKMAVRNPERPCGDGFCDSAEKADPGLCPQDCGGQATPKPAQAEIHSAYRPLTPLTELELTNGTQFKSSTFCRTYFSPESPTILFTFGTGDYSNHRKTGAPQESCTRLGMGFAYRELKEDLKTTLRSGYFLPSPSCGAGDAATVRVGDSLYLLGGPGIPGVTPRDGLRLYQFRISDWKEIRHVDLTLERGVDAENDQMLASVNGHLIASSLHAVSPAGTKKDPTRGEGTWQKEFDLSLNPVASRILNEPPHINGSSLLFVNGYYYLLTSRAYFGELLVIRYDRNWKFVDSKVLAPRGQWPQGFIFENGKFYIAYVDVSQGMTANVVFAVYDSNWNILSRTPVTRFAEGMAKAGGRPSIAKRGNRVYVTYDVESFDPVNSKGNKDWQCRLSVYEWN